MEYYYGNGKMEFFKNKFVYSTSISHLLVCYLASCSKYFKLWSGTKWVYYLEQKTELTEAAPEVFCK